MVFGEKINILVAKIKIKYNQALLLVSIPLGHIMMKTEITNMIGFYVLVKSLMHSQTMQEGSLESFHQVMIKHVSDLMKRK